MPPEVRVLLVHNIMAPYRFPLFRALAETPGIDLTVWFMSRSARNRRWHAPYGDLGFKYEVLPNIELNYHSHDLFTYVVNYTFPLRFARTDFDAMISAGWLDFAAQSGFALSKLLRRKFILWSESTAFEPSWRRFVARPLVQSIVRGSDALIAVGTRSGQYLESLGGRPDRTFTAYSTVDVDLFQHVNVQARPAREELKRSLGITESEVILYCGQLIERKGLRDLMKAFAMIRQSQRDAALVLVGYGPLRQNLVTLAADLGVQEHLHMLDHVEVQEIPKLYAIADVFALASLEETWGLVVNEAMACGLPVVVTDRVGASVDLVQENRNGFIVPASDPTTLGQRIGKLLDDPALRGQFGRNSAAFIQNFTPRRAAEAFAAAVRYVCRRT